ncbi:MAG: putative capsid protein [Circoviridae sp.]|nr:MAG: putative capsid protein [Circoviridae sp.]
MAKIQPAVQTLQYTLPALHALSYIDISQSVSMLNRRFYRQGLQWVVAGFSLHGTNSSETGILKINKLPNTWMVGNAWEKGFRAWDRMNKEAMAENPSIKPKFYDFKIWFSFGHLNEAASILPVDPHGNSYSPYQGEWEISQYLAPTVGGATTVPYDIYMLGQDTPGVAVGLLQNYQQSRSVPTSPDPVTNIDGPESIFTAIFDEGTVQDEDVLDALADENDELPYHQMEYVGTQGTQCENVCILPNINTNQVTRGAGSVFPCGLIEVEGTLTYEATLYVHLVPGPARGYLTQPMTEM